MTGAGIDRGSWGAGRPRDIGLAPFAFDDYLIWRFYRIAFTGAEAIRFRSLLDEIIATDGAKSRFGRGFVDGLYAGARDRLQKEISDYLALVDFALQALGRTYALVYDPAVVPQLVKVILTEPGEAHQSEVYLQLSHTLKSRHPEVIAAIEDIAVLSTGLEYVCEWLRRENAIRQVLGAIAADLGELFAQFLSGVIDNRYYPQKQGEAVGRLTGLFTMEVCLLVIGP